MVKQGWCLVFRFRVINSNFISCNNRWVLVTTARSVVFIGIGEQRPDMKGSCECTEYLAADSGQVLVPQHGRLCEVPATPALTTYIVSKHFTSPRTWTDPWARRKRWKRDTMFGT